MNKLLKESNNNIYYYYEYFKSEHIKYTARTEGERERERNRHYVYLVTISISNLPRFDIGVLPSARW